MDYKKIKAVITPDTLNPVVTSGYTNVSTPNEARDLFFLDENTGIRVGTDAGSTSKIWKTTDGGLTWNEVFSQTGTNEVNWSVCWDRSTKFFVYGNGKIFMSSDLGDTWTDLLTAFTGVKGYAPVMHVDAYFTNVSATYNPGNKPLWTLGDEYFLGDQTFYKGDIWTSTINNNFNDPSTLIGWTQDTTNGFVEYNPNTVYDTLGVKIWQNYVPSDRCYIFEFTAFPTFRPLDSERKKIVSATTDSFMIIDGEFQPAVYYSIDGGVNLIYQALDHIDLSGGWASSFARTIAATDNGKYYIFGLTTNKGIRISSDDYGVTFTQTLVPNLDAVALWLTGFENDNLGFATDIENGSIWKTTDGGLTWTIISTMPAPPTGHTQSSTQNFLKIKSFSDGEDIYLLGQLDDQYASMYVSHSSGADWDAQLIGDGNFVAFCMWVFNSAHWIVDGTSLYYTVNGGSTTTTYPYDIVTFNFSDTDNKQIIPMFLLQQLITEPYNPANIDIFGFFTQYANTGLGVNYANEKLKNFLASNFYGVQMNTRQSPSVFPVAYCVAEKNIVARTLSDPTMDYYLMYAENSNIR